MLEPVEFSDQEISTYYANIAANVKAARLAQHVSQMELAYSIGHQTVSTIAKIEAGLENKHYNIEHLYKISKVLNVDICNLIKQCNNNT